MGDESSRAAGGVNTVMSPMGAYGALLKESCNLCEEKGRDCDGLGWKPCSYCISSKKLVCHYGEDAPSDEAPRDFVPDEQCVGTSRGASEVLVSPRLPLERSRLSASPATGLIGLPENGFLDDFYGSLGFLGLASERTIRDAMVSVMLAALPQFGAVLSSAQPFAHDGGAEGAAGGGAETDESNNGQVVGGLWSKAAVPPDGRLAVALPRNTSTCHLWSAIALGALARGCPVSYVKRYVDLAEDSLAACSGSKSVELARAHIAMAILHNFRGGKVGNRQHLGLANRILSALPPKQVSRDLRDLQIHAGRAWTFERDPPANELVDLDGYWTDDTKLPDSFGQEHVRRFFIRVDSRANSSLLSAAGVSISKVYCAPPPAAAAAAAAAAATTTAAKDEMQVINSGARLAARSGGGCDARSSGSGATAAAQEGNASVSGAEKSASGDGKPHPGMLPEMNRLRGFVERSDMRSGIGGLMFYSIFGIVQTMSKDPAGAIECFWRSLDIKLRYPGICRVNAWLHSTHAHLWSLASGPHRERYEELRTTYNSIRAEGYPPAPPYEEWKGMSDICDTPGVFCKCYVGKARLNAAIEAFERQPGRVDDEGGGSKVNVSFSPYMIDPQTHPEGEEYLAYNKRRWGGDGWTASMKRSSRKDGCRFADWVTWPNSLLAHRLQMFADRAGMGDQVNSLLFQTIYERGGNASDLETLVRVAEEAGLPPVEARAYLRSSEGEDDVLREDHRAKAELKVRGVPYFVISADRPAVGGGASANGGAGASAGGGAASGEADLNVCGSGDGDNSRQPATVVLKGAAETDQLLQAFAAVSRG